MNDKTRKEIALFRCGILVPLISDTYDENKSVQEFLRDAESRVYQSPSGQDTKISA